MESSDERNDFINIRAYHKDLHDLRDGSSKSVADVHREKELEKELLDLCKKYFDKYERNKKTLPIIFKPKHNKEEKIVISNYDAEAFLIGFDDLQADLRAYISSNPPSLLPLIDTKPPIEEQPSKKQYLFRRVDHEKKKATFDIIFNYREFFGLNDIGFEYLYYYIEHSPEEFRNFVVFEAVNAKNRIPVDIKRLPIDLKPKDDDSEETSGYQTGSPESIESRQDVGDYKTIKQINNTLKKLPDEIDEADKEGDSLLKKELEAEMDELEQQLSKYQHNGKLKAFEDEMTKINGNVRRAMDRALDELSSKEGGEEIYSHFKESFKPSYSSHKSKGYKPKNPIPWVLK
jgi:hypothetical protein